MRPIRVFTVSMASGATSTTYVDLQQGWDKVSVVIPSLVSNGDIYFKGSEEAGGTYRRIFHDSNTNSAVVGGHFFGSTVTNCIVPLTGFHLRYIKMEVTTAAADTPATIKFICSY